MTNFLNNWFSMMGFAPCFLSSPEGIDYQPTTPVPGARISTSTFETGNILQSEEFKTILSVILKEWLKPAHVHHGASGEDRATRYADGLVDAIYKIMEENREKGNTEPFLLEPKHYEVLVNADYVIRTVFHAYHPLNDLNVDNAKDIIKRMREYEDKGHDVYVLIDDLFGAIMSNMGLPWCGSWWTEMTEGNGPDFPVDRAIISLDSVLGWFMTGRDMTNAFFSFDKEAVEVGMKYNASIDWLRGSYDYKQTTCHDIVRLIFRNYLAYISSYTLAPQCPTMFTGTRLRTIWEIVKNVPDSFIYPKDAVINLNSTASLVGALGYVPSFHYDNDKFKAKPLEYARCEWYFDGKCLDNAPEDVREYMSRRILTRSWLAPSILLRGEWTHFFVHLREYHGVSSHITVEHSQEKGLPWHTELFAYHIYTTLRLFGLTSHKRIYSYEWTDVTGSNYVMLYTGSGSGKEILEKVGVDASDFKESVAFVEDAIEIKDDMVQTVLHGLIPIPNPIRTYLMLLKKMNVSLLMNRIVPTAIKGDFLIFKGDKDDVALHVSMVEVVSFYIVSSFYPARRVRVKD
ncbi:hypothetical protein B6U83_00170 [Thermoplasmatales archaeon ex4484_36]|nr:MAG: hypothetical protein B6U83_00170 [Thermoplasmatales archaeon ex4484_36]